MNIDRTPAQQAHIAVCRANVAAAETDLINCREALEEAYIASLPVRPGDIVRAGRRQLEAKVVGFYNAEYGWLKCVYRKKDGTWGNQAHMIFEWEK